MIIAKTPAEFLALAVQKIPVRYKQLEGSGAFDEYYVRFLKAKDSENNEIFCDALLVYLGPAQKTDFNRSMRILNIPLTIKTYGSNDIATFTNAWGTHSVYAFMTPLHEMVNYRGES